MKEYFGKGSFEDLLNATGEVGFVDMISYPIVRVAGLPSVKITEVVIFENGDFGTVYSLEPEYADILVFSPEKLKLGMRVARTEERLSIPVGDGILGHVIDPLGMSLDASRPFKSPERLRPIEIKAPEIGARTRIKNPLLTGVAVVDLMVPLGMGQRELVVGDRKTGKTKFLLQTILNQSRKGVICIYSAIGKKKTDIKMVESFFKKKGIFENSLIVATASTDSAGMIYLTPYSAMTFAEYFKDEGKDVLLILDDISVHAKYCREIALLGKMFPGRNSYPSDIFYTHSRLVERAGNFIAEKGEVSITCLPVAETVEGDISSYIVTNLISMTDGHLYFDRDFFSQGRRPAVNYALSVTRVGRQTQSVIQQGASRELSNFLSLYERTKQFTHFGAELSEGTKTTLKMGENIIEFLNQSPDEIYELGLMVIIYCLIWVGTWQKESTQSLKFHINRLVKAYEKSESLRRMVQKLITGSSNFNELLGRITGESPKILQEVENAAEGSREKN